MAVVYFLYQNVFKMYYTYFYFKRQGVPCVGVPLPFLGSIYKMIKHVKYDEFSRGPTQETVFEYFKSDTDLPPLILFFFGSNPLLLVHSEKITQDCFVKYNKHFTKNSRFKPWMYDLIGDSIIFSPSDDQWNTKRKHLSSAFYKEKLIKMIDIVATHAFEIVQNWKKEYAGTDKDFQLFKEPNQMIMNSILASVFGKSNVTRELDYYENGVLIKINICEAVRVIFLRLIRRGYTPIRLVTKLVDTIYINKDEKELLGNIRELRKFIKELIKER